jgi:toluene monooxygenase system ferredoxin subunit
VVIAPACAHMSTPPAEGFFDGCFLTCSKHLWPFSIDNGGAAVGIAEAPLLKYEVKEADGTLWVNLARAQV